MENESKNINLTPEEQEAVDKCTHEIHDIHKFLEHLKAKKLSKKFETYKTSEGKVLKITAPHPVLKKQIKHLPEQEQKKILAFKKNFNSYHTKSGNLFRSSTGCYIKGRSGPDPVMSMISEKKAILLELFGRMFTIDEVVEILKNDWGIQTIRVKALADFYAKNESEISRLKDKHRENFKHLRLTAKTSRIEELTWMYNKLKNRYTLKNSREDHRVLLQTIDSIRKEVEGDRLTIQGSVDMNIQHDVNLHIKNEILKTLPLKEIILGRLSAKLNLQPRDLINDLGKSYYAKMNRMLGEIEDVDFEEIGYPSELTYDFEEIEKKNKQNDLEIKHEEEKRIKKEEQERKAEEASKENNESIKQMLLNKLKKKEADTRNLQQDLKNKFI